MDIFHGKQRETEALIQNLRINLAHHRRRLGWSQATLAEQAGLSPQVISRLETGKYPAKKKGPLVTVKSLARVLSVTIEELVGPHDKHPVAPQNQIEGSGAVTSVIAHRTST